MKDKIIKLLGGFTKDDLIAKEEIFMLEKKEFCIKEYSLRKGNMQLDKWFLAFSDLFDNFNSSKLKKDSFNDITSNRIREVARYYRSFSCYGRQYYSTMEDSMFKELQDFILNDFHEVIRYGYFNDDVFNKFIKLKEKYINSKWQ
ncbi:hypothetical protein ACNSOL_12130 (plasmid) [Aliarcobacter lanthieri]|uniref:hypothetical protein n=1 Tax=Aliarcobacter lanthieri TaxID=1355374 RepID=UPI003AAF9C94